MNKELQIKDIHDTFLVDEFDRLTELDIAQLLADRSKFVDTGCPACHGVDVRPAFNHQGLDYRRCSHCELLYISPAPTEEMHLNYVVNSSAMRLWREHMPESMKKGRQPLYHDRLNFVQQQFHDLGITPRSTIEIGAGNGEFAEELAKHTDIAEIVLLEPQDLRLDFPNVRLIQAGFDALEHVDEQFDAAFAFELIEHLLEPDNFLRLVHRILKPGAPLILSTPNEKSLETRSLSVRSSNILFDHVRLYNPGAIGILLARNGFKVVSLTTPGKLDVQRLLNIHRQEPEYFASDPALHFLLEAIQGRHATLHREFQDHLVNEHQSSHMRVVAIKDGSWQGSPAPLLPATGGNAPIAATG
jgi:SAM-dependent methyltransferase